MISDLRALSPELAIFFTVIFSLLVDIRFRKTNASIGVAIFGLLAAFVLAVHSIGFDPTEIFSKSFIIDPVSQFFKIVLIGTGVATLLLCWMSKEVVVSDKTELYAFVILGTLSMCLLCSAVHFLLIFLAFEMMSISQAVLAAFRKRSTLSSEAGIKFFVYGALTSILFAFGIVMLYGISRSFNILDIRGHLTSADAGSLNYLWVAFGLIFAAIAARMAIFPFHFLVPDLVQGSPSPVAAFFSVSTNIAALALILRLCVHLFSSKVGDAWPHLAGFSWPELLAAISAVTVTLGNLTALYQKNIKRLFGYSCVAQMGYILMGVAVSNQMGLASVLFSIVAYSLVTVGAYIVVQTVIDHKKSEDVEILKGLVWSYPFEAACLCIFLLSLAGLPPLVGFVSRFYVLGAVIREKLYWLSIVAAFNWVICLAYHLQLIRQVFFRANKESERRHNAFAANAALVVLVIPTVLLGIYWDPLMNYITSSLIRVLW